MVSETAMETSMRKKPDMITVVLALFVVSVLASGMAQSALL